MRTDADVWRRRGGFMVAAMVVAACASAPDGNDGAEADALSDTLTLQSARALIDEAIGEARAASLGQCRLVGMGERPCGGPRAYVAYSVAETDSAYLAELMEVYGRLDRERNVREGLMSTCEVMGRPEVGLDGGRCVAGPGR